jgi:hypothetical protein
VRRYPKILRARKRRIERRLAGQMAGDRSPVMRGRNIHYEVSEKSQGFGCGGIGAFHQMAQRIGLVRGIDERLKLLKVHLPYHESDHVLNLTYNILAGGLRLEDLEMLRRDAVFMDALGAARIPDPTTSGDFTRRFEESDILILMDVINEARERVWRQKGAERLKDALIDIDGSVAPTQGECKGGMEFHHTGVWGYHPLMVSLANTKEVLYLVNRPGNVVSHDGCAEWIDRAMELVGPHAQRITLRGDTDFSLTVHLDRWSERVNFVFGMDACAGLVRRANEVGEADWTALERKAKYTVKTEPRERPERVKEAIVVEREFKNVKLVSEWVTKIRYRPARCQKTYDLVILKKNLSVERGEKVLFDDIRYFFYLTTRTDLTPVEVVDLANGRCDQENVIEQVKNGVNAMRMPVNDLLSNWAYMVMAALAWNMKSWFAMMMPDEEKGRVVLRMEFRRFLNGFIRLPCQIIRQGRRILYRLLGYNGWMSDFLRTWEVIRGFSTA